MKFLGHLKTITAHRHKVMTHAFRAGIPLRGILHDLSKYSYTEFSEGIRYYTGKRSPNEGAREKTGYSKAWLHHKGRNKHHFEYWMDYNPKIRKLAPVKMPLIYVKEMFCDRVAASKIYQGKNYTNSHPLEYFERGRNHRQINEETSNLIEKWLVVLKEKGEKEAFKEIRNTKNY